MAKLTKNQKFALAKVEHGKLYTLSEAAELVIDITTTKFDASVDIDVRLGIDPRKSNQMVRGVVSLPNGTGKAVRVLALVTPDKEAEAREAGARIRLITDGDVVPSVDCGIQGSGIHMVLGSGGAPEGVLAAVGLKCLGGDMQAKLLPHTEEELTRMKKMGIDDPNKVLTLDDLVKAKTKQCQR